MNKQLATLSIAIGAALWGIIGLFVTHLYKIGFDATQIVTIRVVITTLMLLPYILIRNRNLFKIKISDSTYFVGTGIISIVFFNWCLFQAISETSISIAFILLYTAPVFVAIFSRILFKESFTPRKLLALCMTMIGCTFVIGVFPSSQSSITLYGLILGLGSGLFYALYSIFGKLALKKYDSLTVTFYTFLFAAIAITPFSGIERSIPLFLNKQVWIPIIGLSFLSTMLPFIFYTKGLENIESSRASIIATIEPVVAAFVGYIAFHEQLTLWQYIGIVIVIAAVMIVQEKTKKQRIISNVKNVQIK